MLVDAWIDGFNQVYMYISSATRIFTSLEMVLDGLIAKETPFPVNTTTYSVALSFARDVGAFILRTV